MVSSVVRVRPPSMLPSALVSSDVTATGGGGGAASPSSHQDRQQQQLAGEGEDEEGLSEAQVYAAQALGLSRISRQSSGATPFESARESGSVPSSAVQGLGSAMSEAATQGHFPPAVEPGQRHRSFSLAAAGADSNQPAQLTSTDMAQPSTRGGGDYFTQHFPPASQPHHADDSDRQLEQVLARGAPQDDYDADLSPQQHPRYGVGVFGRKSGARLLASQAAQEARQEAASRMSDTFVIDNHPLGNGNGAKVDVPPGAEGSLHELTRRASAEEAKAPRAKASSKLLSGLLLGSPFSQSGNKDARQQRGSGNGGSGPPVALQQSAQHRQRSRSDASSKSVTKDELLERLADALRAEKRRGDLTRKDLALADDECDELERKIEAMTRTYRERLRTQEGLIKQLRNDLSRVKAELDGADELDPDEASPYLHLLGADNASKDSVLSPHVAELPPAPPSKSGKKSGVKQRARKLSRSSKATPLGTPNASTGDLHQSLGESAAGEKGQQKKYPPLSGGGGGGGGGANKGMHTRRRSGSFSKAIGPVLRTCTYELRLSAESPVS